MTCVEAINREAGEALLSDGRVAPVSHWFDVSGDDCDPDEAIACVVSAGPHEFYSVDLGEYAGVFLQ